MRTSAPASKRWCFKHAPVEHLVGETGPHLSVETLETGLKGSLQLLQNICLAYALLSEHYDTSSVTQRVQREQAWIQVSPKIAFGIRQKPTVNKTGLAVSGMPESLPVIVSSHTLPQQ